MASKDLRVLSMGLQACPVVPAIYVGARDLNLDPHASTASHLQIEPSPWFLMVLICISMTISDCEYSFIYMSAVYECFRKCIFRSLS